ncbi:MAG: glycosyltransferase [Deltaproteobacteria bacterium]|nr:glycosyltransferase [Deltaproteobacteria bacterium]
MSHPDVLDVSVVVPTRDRPERVATLVARLAGVRTERLRAELIVVDDGSRTPVASALAGARVFGEPVVVLRQGRHGPARARNLGASHARGELLLFFADDLEPSAAWLDEHVRAHREPGAAPWAIVGRIDPPPGGGDTPFDRFTWRAGVHFDFAGAARELESQGSVSFARYSSNLSVPRAAFDAAGGFDELFPGAAWEDVELGYRLRERGVRLGYRPAAAVRALPGAGRSLGEYLRWRETALPSAQRAIRLAPPLAERVARREPPRWRGARARWLGAAIGALDRLDRLGVPLPPALYRRLLGHFAPLAEAPDGAETPVRAGRIVRDPTTGAVRFDARGSDSVIAGELLLEALHPFRQRLAGRLLDLGCGDGPLRAPLQLASEGYLGVDRSPRAVPPACAPTRRRCRSARARSTR